MTPTTTETDEKTPEPGKDEVRVHFRLPPDVRDRLAQYAHDSGFLNLGTYLRFLHVRADRDRQVGARALADVRKTRAENEGKS